jgi:hypothetical protein
VPLLWFVADPDLLLAVGWLGLLFGCGCAAVGSCIIWATYPASSVPRKTLKGESNEQPHLGCRVCLATRAGRVLQGCAAALAGLSCCRQGRGLQHAQAGSCKVVLQRLQDCPAAGRGVSCKARRQGLARLCCSACRIVLLQAGACLATRAGRGLQGCPAALAGSSCCRHGCVLQRAQAGACRVVLQAQLDSGPVLGLLAQHAPAQHACLFGLPSCMLVAWGDQHTQRCGNVTTTCLVWFALCLSMVVDVYQELNSCALVPVAVQVCLPCWPSCRPSHG